MKDSCIRLKNCDSKLYEIENNLEKLKIENDSIKNLKKFEKIVFRLGYNKIFDTKKFNHHYYKKGMKSKIQLQQG